MYECAEPIVHVYELWPSVICVCVCGIKPHMYLYQTKKTRIKYDLYPGSHFTICFIRVCKCIRSLCCVFYFGLTADSYKTTSAMDTKRLG